MECSKVKMKSMLHIYIAPLVDCMASGQETSAEPFWRSDHKVVPIRDIQGK